MMNFVKILWHFHPLDFSICKSSFRDSVSHQVLVQQNNSILQEALKQLEQQIMILNLLALTQKIGGIRYQLKISFLVSIALSSKKEFYSLRPLCPGFRTIYKKQSLLVTPSGCTQQIWPQIKLLPFGCILSCTILMITN